MDLFGLKAMRQELAELRHFVNKTEWESTARNSDLQKNLEKTIYEVNTNAINRDTAARADLRDHADKIKALTSSTNYDNRQVHERIQSLEIRLAEQKRQNKNLKKRLERYVTRLERLEGRPHA